MSVALLLTMLPLLPYITVFTIGYIIGASIQKRRAESEAYADVAAIERRVQKVKADSQRLEDTLNRLDVAMPELQAWVKERRRDSHGGNESSPTFTSF